jgi:hypothetical protein
MVASSVQMRMSQAEAMSMARPTAMPLIAQMTGWRHFSSEVMAAWKRWSLAG